MGAINKAIADVYFSIPIEILNIAFNDTIAPTNPSMDDIILSRVIRPKVLVDCNLVGGVTQYIDIGNCFVHDYTNAISYEFIVDVPKKLTGGRSIISAIGLFTSMPSIHSIKQGSPVTGQIGRMMNNTAPPTPMATARLELVGENKVLVVDPVYHIFGGSLKCVIENADDLSNITPRAQPMFSKLVLLAVKAYIYNNLVVRLGKGYIYNGHELGIVTDLINDYSSALADYNEYLDTVWSKVAYHTDKQRLSSFIAAKF